MKKTSKQFTVDIWDILKAFVVASISGAIPAIIESLNTGSLNIDWRSVTVVALSAGLGYLVKNFFSPQKIVASPEELEQQ